MRRLLSLGIMIFSLIAAWGQQVTDSVLIIRGGTLNVPELAYYEREDFHTVRFEAPAKISSIGNYAFRNCCNLRNIELPKSLHKIGTGAFAFCENLTDITLPMNLQDIGAQAFAYCLNLEKINIPQHVSHIGANAFSFCRKIRTVVLPRHMKELESYAFSECTSLENVTLPANANLLGEMIFYGCSSLRKIVEPSPTPPPFDCNSQLFDLEETDSFENCLLEVPKNSVDKYRTSEGWKLFKRIKEIY